jgi:cell division protein FtsB
MNKASLKKKVFIASALLLAIAAGALVYDYATGGRVKKLVLLRDEILKLNESNDKLRMENDELRRQVETLKTNMKEVEKIARRQMKLIRSDEILLNTEGEPGANEADKSVPAPPPPPNDKQSKKKAGH